VNAKPRKQTAMGAAECATRTKLTVKALRVYERHKLITPARSAQGWRLYGPKELARLNTIVFLKGLGLTLAQIAEALTGATPSFEKVLQIQLDTLKARRSTTDEAIGLVEAALGRLKTRKHLSIDELCALVRSGETGDLHAISKELVLEMFTNEERMRWFAYSATRSQDRALNAEHFHAASAIVQQMARLMDQGTDPASPEPQRLLLRNHDLVVRYGFREKYLDMLDWDAALAHKIFAYGTCLMERTARMGKRTSEGLFNYMLEVRGASEWGPALDRLCEEAKVALANGALPGSPQARTLATRLANICEHYGLGEATNFARFQAAFGRNKSGHRWVAYDAQTAAGWEYLALASTSWTMRER
jgi:DNA-binding transcriptional MerR regulator